MGLCKRRMTSSKSPIGVLGGMGPSATTDFLNKIVLCTPGTVDQQHVPIILYSNPEIPDRSTALLRGGASPLPLMAEGVAWLNSFELACVAIPCNTAHWWYDELKLLSENPILHIAQVLCDSLCQSKYKSASIISTVATANYKIYNEFLEKFGVNLVPTDLVSLSTIVEPSITLIKRGLLQEARCKLLPLIDDILSSGVDCIILGCTELPIALDGLGLPYEGKLLDPTLALAQECVRLSCERKNIS